VNILFISYTRIGDAVMSTGLLAALVERHPNARVTIGCGPASAPLFAAAPFVERVIVIRKRALSWHWLELWATSVLRRWDLIVDLRNSALPYLLLARRRLVLRRTRNDRNRVEQLGALLGLDPPPSPRIWLSERHRARAAELIGAQEPPILALGPTANWPGKIWPAVNFADLALRLTASNGILPGARVAILAAPSERADADAVLRLIPAAQRLDLAGQTDLLTAAAVLEKVALYVGNDSGLMHIAAAAGVPTLGLFGPSREQLYAPWGPHAAAVRTPESFEHLIDRPGYNHRTTGSLMGSLRVDAVERAAMQLWRHSQGRRP